MVLSLKNYKWVNKCLRLSCESRFCTYRFRNDIDAYLFWSTGFYFERISLIQGFLKGGGCLPLILIFKEGSHPQNVLCLPFSGKIFFMKGGGVRQRATFHEALYNIWREASQSMPSCTTQIWNKVWVSSCYKGYPGCTVSNRDSYPIPFM